MRNRPVVVLMILLVQGLAGAVRPSPAQVSSSGSNTKSPPTGTLFDPFGALEKKLVFFPARYPDGNWQPRGFSFEDAWFRSADGVRLHGWYLPHERPRAVVLFCHGNGGNVAHWAGVLRILKEQVGAAVLGFDYRGYGRSEGKPGEAGVYADARAARAWLAGRAGIPEKRVVLMGRSLGGAVAVDLAASDGARGLVLESTFTSIPEVAADRYPLLPATLLMPMQFNSLAKIRKYRGPLLQSHGDADRVVPYKLGRKLFDAANEPKQFVTIRRGDHNDPQTAEYYQALVAFLSRLD